MAFVITDDRVDKVTFYKKPCFAGVDTVRSIYIERGNMDSLRYNILEHMDTKIKERRPDTPCKLIIPRYDPAKIFSDQ
ncbi:hypothetical protein N9P79_01185 [Crocinitomicaceae bacterium]|jgi:hypothetical protein|nr:hypothetical protein [Crocinitomicaceae bacterium]